MAQETPRADLTRKTVVDRVFDDSATSRRIIREMLAFLSFHLLGEASP